MYPALTSDAALCIVPEEMRLDLEGMNAYFEKKSRHARFPDNASWQTICY